VKIKRSVSVKPCLSFFFFFFEASLWTEKINMLVPGLQEILGELRQVHKVRMY
jgi:hypothetical protein